MGKRPLDLLSSGFFLLKNTSKIVKSLSLPCLTFYGPKSSSLPHLVFYGPKSLSLPLTSTYHPQSNDGQEKFHNTLIEDLRTYVSHRQDNWDECLLYFKFMYSNLGNPSTGVIPLIPSYAQSPHLGNFSTPVWYSTNLYLWFLPETQKVSVAQSVSYLGLDIINNVC